MRQFLMAASFFVAGSSAASALACIVNGDLGWACANVGGSLLNLWFGVEGLRRLKAGV